MAVGGTLGGLAPKEAHADGGPKVENSGIGEDKFNKLQQFISGNLPVDKEFNLDQVGHILGQTASAGETIADLIKRHVQQRCDEEGGNGDHDPKLADQIINQLTSGKYDYVVGLAVEKFGDRVVAYHVLSKTQTGKKFVTIVQPDLGGTNYKREVLKPSLTAISKEQRAKHLKKVTDMLKKVPSNAPNKDNCNGNGSGDSGIKIPEPAQQKADKSIRISPIKIDDLTLVGVGLGVAVLGAGAFLKLRHQRQPGSVPATYS